MPSNDAHMAPLFIIDSVIVLRERIQLEGGNIDDGFVQALPLVAQRLELSLFRSAKSFEDYANGSTLRDRLFELADKASSRRQKNVLQRKLRKRAALQKLQKPNSFVDDRASETFHCTK